MDDIYSYADYRLYLKDYYTFHKAENPAFSYRYLARKAGVNSSAFFKFIIEGKRNLTKQTVLKIAAALKFDENEREYFENLVFFNQAETVKERDHFFSRLVQQQKVKKAARIGEDYYEYFSAWHHCVIRELVAMIDFNDNWELLGKLVKPRISAKQAKQSVELLLKLGFLEKNNGRYKQTEPVVSTGYGIKAHQVVRFQIEMLKNAIEAFTGSDESQRLNSSTTFGISGALYAQFIAMIRDFRLKLMELARNDRNPEMVYQLNLNLFPVSERVDDSRGKP
ncbi:MAG: TIGR02147 family protein [Chitinispirillaceae bacterium]|nr:TIGR02147 family protein [Chitinispirillaceae bacterium]